MKPNILQGSTVRLKVFRSVERRTFDVALVRGSTEGWSLSDKLKDMEGKMKERDSVIDLLRMQLTSAQEREARSHDLASIALVSGGGGHDTISVGSTSSADGARGKVGGGGGARGAGGGVGGGAGGRRGGTTEGMKAAELAIDSFFSFMNPAQNLKGSKTRGGKGTNSAEGAGGVGGGVSRHSRDSGGNAAVGCSVQSVDSMRSSERFLGGATADAPDSSPTHTTLVHAEGGEGRGGRGRDSGNMHRHEEVERLQHSRMAKAEEELVCVVWLCAYMNMFLCIRVFHCW